MRSLRSSSRGRIVCCRSRHGTGSGQPTYRREFSTLVIPGCNPGPVHQVLPNTARTGSTPPTRRLCTAMLSLRSAQPFRECFADNASVPTATPRPGRDRPSGRRTRTLTQGEQPWRQTSKREPGGRGRGRGSRRAARGRGPSLQRHGAPFVEMLRTQGIKTLAVDLPSAPWGDEVAGLTSPPAEAGGFFPCGLSFLLLGQRLPRTNGKGRGYARQSYASSADLTSRRLGGRPGRLGYHRPDGLQTTSLLRVVGGGRRSALAANRLSLPCSAGVRFLPRLKAGVSTE
ncbi:hypothetical protein SRB17_89090 [Streptomyces sp. RB17]|nr:hypothetical protein [Streptomyces sp. RB17]